jgi:DNA-binding MarR family transcriptional regulator
MLTASPADVQTQQALERDAEIFHEALSGLVRLCQFRNRDKICCFDVSVAQCHALEALVAGGPLTLGELAEHLYVDKSTASRIVDALERKGYLARAVHPVDARALRLSVTSGGRRLVKRIRASLVEEAKAVLGDLSPEFRQEASSLIRRLTSVAAERLRCGPRSLRGDVEATAAPEAAACCPRRPGEGR